MKEIKNIVSIVVLASILLWGTVGGAIAQEHQESIDILILNAYPATEMGNRMVAAFTNAYKQQQGINYYVEYLYTTKHGLSGDPNYMKEKLRNKYQGVGIDAVVALGQDAFSFIDLETVKQDRKTSYFVGSVDYDMAIVNNLENQQKLPYFLGNATKVSLEKNVKVIKEIQPMVETIYIYCDNHYTPYFCGEDKRIQGALVKTIHWEDLNQLDTDDMEKHKTSYAMLLPYIGYSRDGDNRYPENYIREIQQYYPGPMYFTDKEIYDYLIEIFPESSQLMGGLMRDRVREAAYLGEQIYNSLSGKEVVNHLKNPIGGSVVLNGNSLNYYELNSRVFNQKYLVEWGQKADIIIPKGDFINLLIGLAGVLIVIAILLLCSSYRNQRLTKKVDQEQQEYQLLLSILPQGVLEIQGDRVSYINAYAASIFGQHEGTAVVEEDIRYFTTDGCSDCGIEWTGDVFKDDGEPIPSSVQLITYDDEQQMKLFLVKDLSQQKLLKEKRYYYQVHQDVFIHLSHDIKTPIQVILSALQLMEMYHDKEKQKVLTEEHFQLIRQNSYRLFRLLNNLIDLAKIEDNCLVLNRQIYNLVQVTEELVEQVVPIAKAMGFHLVVDPEEEDLYAEIDRGKYERCLLNVISNGLKYGSQGGTITIHMDSQQDIICIKILTPDKGIPSYLLEDIFSPFVQQDKSSTRRAEGSGLGLAVVKELVELHSGYIRMSSSDKKSCVEIFLFRDCQADRASLGVGDDVVNPLQVQVELSDLDN